MIRIIFLFSWTSPDSLFQTPRGIFSNPEPKSMPSKPNVDEQVYEAIRTSNGVPFEIVTGGVRYKAVLQHKEARYVAVLVKFLRHMTDEVKGSGSQVLPQVSHQVQLPRFEVFQ
jgi:hypothetical protein